MTPGKVMDKCSPYLEEEDAIFQGSIRFSPNLEEEDAVFQDSIRFSPNLEEEMLSFKIASEESCDPWKGHGQILSIFGGGSHQSIF